MNPITSTRYNAVRYFVLWVLLAVAYAASMGLAAALPVGLAAVGGAVFGVVAGFEGLILWSVLKYGAEGIKWPLLKTVYHTVVGILFVAVAMGAEIAAIYLLTAGVFAAFVRTIPALCLITAAVYVCFVLWYSSVARSEEGGEFADDLATPGGGVAGPSPLSEQSGPSTPEPSLAVPLERITVRGAGGRIEVIEVGRIAYIKAEGDYVSIVTPDGRWLKEGTMKYFEESLPRERFVRVHRSYIVAVDHISRIETSGRDHTLVLRGVGNTGIGISRNSEQRGTVGASSIRLSDTGYRLLKRTLGL